MVAVAQQHTQPRHLRVVSDEDVAALDAQRRQDLVFLRRRLGAVAIVVLLLVGMGLALDRASGERAGAPVPSVTVAGSDPSAALPIAQSEYVVQPGDTLWEIARALQPEGDVRPLVYQLGKERKGAPLRVGERITLP